MGLQAVAGQVELEQQASLAGETLNMVCRENIRRDSWLDVYIRKS
jgi:hypothetical protein